MNRCRFCLVFVIFSWVIWSSAQTNEQPPFYSIQTQYRLAQDQLSTEWTRKGEKLKIDYFGALERARESAKVSGNLDLVLAIKDEMGRIENDAKPSKEQRSAMPKTLADLRNQFDTADQRMADEHAAKLVDLTARYVQNLEILEKKLTARDDIPGALLVRSEKERVTTTPASAGSEDQDAWTKSWTNITDWGSADKKAKDNWAPDDMKPGSFENVPPYDPARKGIMGFHPVDKVTPAALHYEGTISALKPILSVQAAGNVRGDCLLVCVVDGREEGSFTLDGQSWKTCNYDLSAHAGLKVTIDLQIAAGGKNPWYYEHGFIDRIDFIPKSTTPASAPAQPSADEVEILTLIDDGCEVFLNGSRVDVVPGKVGKIRVHTGDLLAVKAWDVQGGNAGGLAMSLTQPNGRRLKTDSQWKWSSKVLPGWQEPSYDDKEWDRARIVNIDWITASLKKNYSNKRPLIIWGKGGTVYFRRVINLDDFD